MNRLGKRKLEGEWYGPGSGSGSGSGSESGSGAERSPVAWLSDERYARLPAAHRALAWAARAVGERESGRNRGPFVEHVQELAGLGSGGGFAWCACFVYWACRRAGVGAGRLPSRGECAAVRRWVEWAGHHGRLVRSPRRGDIFYWLEESGQGHIGFVLGSPLLGIFATIEGNTDAGEGSREGDGVYRRTRTLRGLAKMHRFGFIRLEEM